MENFTFPKHQTFKLKHLKKKTMDFLIDHFWSILVCIHPTIPIWLATTNKPIQLSLISYTNPTTPNFVNKAVQIEKNVIIEKFVAT